VALTFVIAAAPAFLPPSCAPPTTFERHGRKRRAGIWCSSWSSPSHAGPRRALRLGQAPFISASVARVRLPPLAFRMPSRCSAEFDALGSPTDHLRAARSQNAAKALPFVLVAARPRRAPANVVLAPIVNASVCARAAAASRVSAFATGVESTPSRALSGLPESLVTSKR